MRGYGKWLAILGGTVALALIAFVVNQVMAENPQSGLDTGWNALYWNNTTLSGRPVLERTETAIDYEWRASSPDGAVSNDEFSVRWTRTINVPPDLYRFVAVADDGIRVWLDDELILDQWRNGDVTRYETEAEIGPGPHQLRVEYYEEREHATAKLTWERMNPVADSWRAEYFNNLDFSGQPALVRDDSAVRFDWQDGSPQPGVIHHNDFSVRWTRTIDFGEEAYRFFLTSHGPSRLYVDGELIIDVAQGQPLGIHTRDIAPGGGALPVTVEYFNEAGSAAVHLFWAEAGERAASPQQLASSSSELVMAAAPYAGGEGTIIDNGDLGFVRGGPVSRWQTEKDGFGGDMSWSMNNEVIESDYNWARWYPNVEAGRYEVSVYIPEKYSSSRQARYWISHIEGLTLREVDQAANGGRWVSLGTYEFRGSELDYLSLADVSFETLETRFIAWDAAKFEKR